MVRANIVMVDDLDGFDVCQNQATLGKWVHQATRHSLVLIEIGRRTWVFLNVAQVRRSTRRNWFCILREVSARECRDYAGEEYSIA
jgi:hypothetical protein